jgi:putative effector of murein hydrolase/putative effector of murein hydrolase LrgA (UPF0299 family)
MRRCAFLLVAAVALAICGAERPVGGALRRPLRLLLRPRLATRGRSAMKLELIEPRAALLPAGSVLTLFATNAASGAALRACGSTFSPSLATMLGLTATMCALASAAPDLAERVYAFFRPGCALLARWLPCFYLPSLVALALSRPQISGARLAAFCAFCIGTLVANCAVGVAVTRLLLGRPRRDDDGGAARPSSVAAVAPAAVAPASRGLPRLVLPLAVTAAACYACAASVGAPALRALSLDGFMLSSTALALRLGESVPARVRVWVQPIVSATALTTLALAAASALHSGPSSIGARYAAGAGRVLSALLAPTVASFAFALYAQRVAIGRSLAQLLAVIAISSCAGLAGSAALARALGFEEALQLALVPRSITTPLALEAARSLGADAELVLLAVCVTGLFTVTFGRRLVLACGVDDGCARGVAMGCAGNGGSTLALADDAAAFPYAVGSMVLNGAFTVVLLSIPWVRRALLLPGS